MIVSPALADAVAAKIVANGLCMSPTTAVLSLPLGVTNNDRVKSVEKEIPVKSPPYPSKLPLKLPLKIPSPL